ncbi:MULTISPECIES: acyltransferase [Vibrio harveyi group]|uniref:acyltransferase n=1 Tax=Vibrio harveyi group TaxID=717610 RepID=UPI000693B041|nr:MULTISPECIES: acyltransferase [Vibrio harveyi group]ELZ7231627.1 acyltransferase [Vibrio parahaemolyticus]MCG6461607.1 acyltransferase [Vibrio parahaemolyticus]MDF5654331.1 acyltransferase [Vibrio parahaemolyticus]TOG42277.1 hypothetical protein CGJ02_07060 [Vibrio parahaemolyticus]HBC3353710.1 acyltransferase [Vibrio parahaemolyticus]
MVFYLIFNSLIFFVLNNLFLPPKLRGYLISLGIKQFKFGESASVRGAITYYGGSKFSGTFSMGNNCFINSHCFIDYSGTLIIKDDVTLSMNVTVLTSTHKIGPVNVCGETKRKTTVIGSNSWLGANVLVYPGITIGDNTVVAAGEIVREDVPSGYLLKDGVLYPLVF